MPPPEKRTGPISMEDGAPMAVSDRSTSAKSELCERSSGLRWLAVETKTRYQPSTSSLARARRERRAQKAMGVLTCTACGQTRALTALVAIKQSRDGYYGACRACRADHARTRYQADPRERAAQIQRAQRNRRKRVQARQEAANGAAADFLSGAGGTRLLPAALACSERPVTQSDPQQADTACQRKRHLEPGHETSE
jgi:hypothetical protein